MRTPENIVYHELIGLQAEVVDENVSGKIIDETMNTIVLETKKGEKKIQKKNKRFKITLPDKRKVTIDGNIILTRPEDRIKKRMKKW